MPNLGYMVVQFFHLLALSIWIGGTFVLYALLDSRSSPDVPTAVAGGELTRRLLHKFDRVKYVCCVLLVLSSITKFILWERNWNVWFAGRYAAILVMISTAVVAGGIVNRELRALSPASTGVNQVREISASSPLRAREGERAARLRLFSRHLNQVGMVAALVALLLS